MKNDRNASYIVRDLVLAGAGHSHVEVLRRLAMAPVGGLRVTVVSREVHTPYSGMLPGFIAGHYRWDEIHIDLAPLAARAGARLVTDTVTGVDLTDNVLLCADRPPIRFDLLSINSGSAPSIGQIQGADQFGIPVKPIDRFLSRWQKLLDRLRAGDGSPFRLAVVGGGAGGVELALSIRYRLAKVENIDNVDIFLITAGERLLIGHNASVQSHLENELARKGIEVHKGAHIVAADPGSLRTESGRQFAADEVLWVTQAAAQKWSAESSLAVDPAGFIRVNEHLQSVSHPQVFAAGDVAGIDDHPRPKSGVFAVRQAPALAENLRRAATARPLVRYKPQRLSLSLISTGDRRAVASRERFAARGAWVWHWKNFIDRRFMARFRVEELSMRAVKPKWSVPVPEQTGSHAEAMRCGGCGSKLGSDLLASVLSRLRVFVPAEVVTGIGDDAAVLRPVLNSLEVQSIDGFRAMIDDPYLVGRIAAEHANNDVYAMGGTPRTALAWITVPYADERIMEDDLFQLMSGAIQVFEAAGAAVIGGHSSEGAELGVGFAVTGTVDERDVWHKHRLSIGDYLVLTKPIGTGALLAAHMRARCRAEWLVEVLAHMQLSNRDAVPVLRYAGVKACTDVTGFGLLGHAGEMARAARLSVEIWPRAVPTLFGARETMRAGVVSSLQATNERALVGVDLGPFDAADIDVRLSSDPQTSGGLLAAVGPGKLQACLTGLRMAGYAAAAVVGRVCAARDDGLWGVLAVELKGELAEEVPPGPARLIRASAAAQPPLERLDLRHPSS